MPSCWFELDGAATASPILLIYIAQGFIYGIFERR